MMRILLVNPPRFREMPVAREDRCENTVPNLLPPMGLVYLGGLLEKENAVDLIDANGLDLDYANLYREIEKRSPEIVIFRATPETFDNDVETAAVSKRSNPRVKTVMISWSLTGLAEEVLEAAKPVDYYITDYRYEHPIQDLARGAPPEHILGIAYREDDTTRLNPPRRPDMGYDIPAPAWHLIPDFGRYWVQVPSFRPYAVVESMKGCGMGCSFCTIAQVKPTFRSPASLCDEIEYLHIKRGVRYLGFFDATFNLRRERVFEICEELHRRRITKLRWFANIRADKMDIEQAQAMRKVGCRGVSLGIESGSQHLLDSANKNLKVAEAAETTRILRKAHIRQYASFIIGLPGENRRTVEETKQFILRTRPTGFQVNSLVPYPGCELHSLAVERMGKMRFSDMKLHDTPVSVCDLPVDEINRCRERVYRDVYSSPSWWLTNIKEAATSPSDLPATLHYAAKIVRRLLFGVGHEV